MNVEAILVAIPEVIAAMEFVAEQLGLDKHEVIRLAAEKLPALVSTPKEELSDYDAARAIATSER